MSRTTIHGTFEKLNGLRQERLDASEHFAYFTIPSLFPKLDTGDEQTAVGMLDSIGANVVNHFANKLVTTLFSPNRPFFRLAPDAAHPQIKKLNEQLNAADAQTVQAAQNQMKTLRQKFSDVEQAGVRYLEKIGYRTSATTAAKLLIVTGDVVIRSSKGKKSPVYNMRDYVCKKDAAGDDILLIVRDTIPFFALSDDHQSAVRAERGEATIEDDEDIAVYTQLERQQDGRFEVTQAVENTDLESQGMVTKTDSPFVHLSWNLSRGENYGRGLVEDFSGSFTIIDSLTNNQIKMAARLADQKILVDPASGIDLEHLNNSEATTYVAGRPGDVNNLATGIDQGMQYIDVIIQNHKRQISAAFLFQAGQTRDAERVTAQEIQHNAAELEIAHGGVYSRMGADWQVKVAHDCTAAVGDKLPDAIEPEIMTGMDSLSRTGEMQSIRYWMDDLSMMNNIPEDVRMVIKSADFASYAALQRGVEHGAFIKSAAEINAEIEAQRAREDQLAQQQADMQAQAGAQQAVAQNM